MPDALCKLRAEAAHLSVPVRLYSTEGLISRTRCPKLMVKAGLMLLPDVRP